MGKTITQNPKDPLMSVNEVADVLGFHRHSIYRWCYDGTIPSVKVGNRRRIRWSDVKRMAIPTDPQHQQSTIRRDGIGHWWKRITEAEARSYLASHKEKNNVSDSGVQDV